MAKAKIDTSTIPETLTAPWIKRFFKERYNIPVRVNKVGGNDFISIWIMSDRSIDYHHSLVYHYHFPRELGNHCLRLAYPTSEKLCEQTWAGNIQQHSLAMLGSEFRQLFQDLIEAED